MSRWTSLLTSDKTKTQRLFEEHGVPTPKTRIFTVDEKEEAQRFAQQIGWPVVVKPRRGGCGRGVSTDVRSEASFERALHRLEEDGYGHDDILIQRHFTGSLYRVLASRDRVYGAYFNLPAVIVGDGQSAIALLVEKANEIRQRNPHLGDTSRAMRIDEDALLLLEAQGFEPLSVPPLGAVVALGTVDNPNRGTETVEVYGSTHATVDELAMRAVRAIPELDYAGVDIILRDGHEVPATPENSAVLEVNCGAGLGGHLYPVYGAPRNVCREIVLDTTRAAGLASPENPADGFAAVAVRLMHRQGSDRRELKDAYLGPASAEPAVRRGDALFALLKGTRRELYESIHDALAREFGTIIAARIDGLTARQGLDALDQLLQPSPFLPLVHGEALSRVHTLDF